MCALFLRGNRYADFSGDGRHRRDLGGVALGQRFFQMNVERLIATTTLTAALMWGVVGPAYAASPGFSNVKASPSFSEVTGESPSTLTPCVQAGLSSLGISSQQMLVDLLTSGPRTRDAVANQLRAVEASCRSEAGVIYEQSDPAPAD
jgi:hypothetical protein